MYLSYSAITDASLFPTPQLFRYPRQAAAADAAGSVRILGIQDQLPSYGTDRTVQYSLLEAGLLEAGVVWFLIPRSSVSDPAEEPNPRQRHTVPRALVRKGAPRNYSEVWTSSGTTDAWEYVGSALYCALMSNVG